jgi:uncharacterized membrane protein YoaK (UPF0700 family)
MSPEEHQAAYPMDTPLGGPAKAVLSLNSGGTSVESTAAAAGTAAAAADKYKAKPPSRRRRRHGCCEISDWSTTWPMRLVGSVLNLNAGYVNACVFAEYNVGTTHVTGTATVLGVNLVQGNYWAFARLLSQLALFIFGGFLCSLTIGGQQKYHPGPHYSAVLFAISALVFVASFQTDSMVVCSFLVTVAAGMQNAMTTFFSGAAIRTTHLTGTATDIGIELANWARKRPQYLSWKLKLLLCFMQAFLLGAILGTGASGLWRLKALWFPAGLCLLLSALAMLDYSQAAKVPVKEVQEEQKKEAVRLSRRYSKPSSGVVAPEGAGGAGEDAEFSQIPEVQLTDMVVEPRARKGSMMGRILHPEGAEELPHGVPRD